MSHREFADTAGAYVLGALGPEEREAFAEHLSSCQECQGSVHELAGLPGLLSRVAVADVLALDAEADPVDAPPARLLPDLLSEARRRRSRRRLRAVLAGVAAAAAAVVLLTVVLLGRPDVPAATVRAMTPVASSVPVSATLQVTSVPWGTRLQLVCRYADQAPDGVPYTLVVSDRSGRVEQVASWTALPGKVATMDGSTSVRAQDIAAVEVRTAAGTPVLRLPGAPGVPGGTGPTPGSPDYR